MAYAGQTKRIPLGAGGLAGSNNLALVSPSQLIAANSITLEEGTLRKEGGATKLNSAALTGAPSIVAGHDWWPSSASQRSIVATDGGDLLKDSGDGSFGVTLKAGLTLTATSVPVFNEGGQEDAGRSKKLFFYNGSDPVQVLTADGAVTTNLTSPPADWAGVNQPTFGLIHDQYHWAFGNANDPHRLYYSSPDDHEDFSANNSIAVYPGQGERLIGAISFKGLLICWKYPKGIYTLNTSDPNTNNWKVSKLTERIGMASPAAFAQLDDDVIFMGPAGNIHSLYGIQQYGDLGLGSPSNLNDMDNFIRRNVALGQLGTTRAIYYSAKRQAMFSVAGIGSTVNNRRLILDYNTQQLRFMWSERDTPISLWLRRDTYEVERPAMGDDAGFVWDMDKTNRSKDGAGFDGTIRTADMDLAHIDDIYATIKKQFDFLALIIQPMGDWNLAIDIYIDGSLRKTLQFNMGSSGSTLGSFVLDTDVLAGDTIETKIRRVGLYGKRIGFGFRNSGAGQDFSVAGVILYFRPGKG